MTMALPRPDLAGEERLEELLEQEIERLEDEAVRLRWMLRELRRRRRAASA